jgi:hypothetical protein
MKRRLQVTVSLWCDVPDMEESGRLDNRELETLALEAASASMRRAFHYCNRVNVSATATVTREGGE